MEGEIDNETPETETAKDKVEKLLTPRFIIESIIVAIIALTGQQLMSKMDAVSDTLNKLNTAISVQAVHIANMQERLTTEISRSTKADEKHDSKIDRLEQKQ